MIRRLGAFLGNGLFQIGAGIELFFDHPREGMQAFEAVRPFGIAEFGCGGARRPAPQWSDRKFWSAPGRAGGPCRHARTKTARDR